MLVLIVIMTTSLIMLGMFQSLHLQTSESLARQRIVVNRSMSEAAVERSIAILINDPNYAGDQKFETPPGSGRISLLSIQPSPADKDLIELNLTLYGDTSTTKLTRILSRPDIERRRKDLGL